MIVFGVLVLSLLGGELFARYGLELGDPVLMQSHAAIEYLPKPDQDVRIYGSRHRINAYGMRSEDPPQNAQAVRVLVLGDSVIYGGRRTDHSALSTTITQAKLRESFDQDVWVGNASAGSWGPGNWLAYVEAFGTFEADVAIVVLSPHDIGDTPRFDPTWAATQTTQPPFSALGVAMQEVWSRVRSRLGSKAAAKNPNDLNQPGIPIPEPDEPHRITAEQDLTALLGIFAKQKIPAAVLYFPEADADGRHDSVRGRFKEIAEANGAKFIDLRERLLNEDPATNPAYRDRMHPSHEGQRRIADAMVEAVKALIATKPQ
ncbi:MAG: SGNH/GDSL hydrolase family protein [Planctomycetota bacterium]